MRVLHVSAGNIYGGIERLLGTLAAEKALCPRMSPEFALCFRGRNGDELQSYGAPVHYLGPVRARSPFSIRRGRRSLSRLIQDRKIDVLVTHAPWPHAMFGPASSGADVPVVLWLHAPLSGEHWLDKWAASIPADATICNSHYTMNASRLLLRSAPHRVICYPISPPGAQATVPRPLRQELGVGDHETLIVQLGRIDRYKGHSYLLSALSLLPKSLPWRCMVVGGAHGAAGHRLEARLHALVKALGLGDRVIFLGERLDVGHILASCDILCQPNISPEAFGIAIVEAMWEGVAVIATSLGGPVEILGSRHGRLIPPGDAGSLAKEIMTLVTDRVALQQLKETGPCRARELCDPSRQLNEVASFLESVAGDMPADTRPVNAS